MTEAKTEAEPLDEARKKLASLTRRAHSTMDARVADVLSLEKRSNTREEGLRGELKDAARSTLIALDESAPTAPSSAAPTNLLATSSQGTGGEVSYTERFCGDGREVTLGVTLTLLPGQAIEEAWEALRDRTIAWGLHEVRDLSTLAAITAPASLDPSETGDT